MTRDVLYMRLDEIDAYARSADELFAELRPGDLLFFKNRGGLSDLISRFDGYWSHSAIVLSTADDGTPRLAHSVDPGAVIDEISMDRLRAKGPDGAALARFVGDDEGAPPEAADWARHHARPRATFAEDPDSLDFAGRDLGMAAALLWRGLLRQQGRFRVPRRRPTPPAQPPDTADRPMPPGFTCAGFVFASYARGAHFRLEPHFADQIIRLDDNYVLCVEDPDVQSLAAATLSIEDEEEVSALFDLDDALTDDPHTDDPPTDGPHTEHEHRISKGEIMIALKGFPQIFRALANNTPLPIDRVLSPGALWLSRHIEPVMYVDEESRRLAHEATKRARDKEEGR